VNILRVFGQFRNSYEYAPGVKWYPINSHRVWLAAEGLRIVKSRVASIIVMRHDLLPRDSHAVFGGFLRFSVVGRAAGGGGPALQVG